MKRKYNNFFVGPFNILSSCLSKFILSHHSYQVHIFFLKNVVKINKYIYTCNMNKTYILKGNYIVHILLSKYKFRKNK